MSENLFPWRRYGTLTALVTRSHRPLGRTALMKLAYLLQVLKGVPVGYRFTLYDYGPFDSTLLADLSHLQTLEAIEQQVVQYPSGPGFEIRKGSDPEFVLEKASEFIERYSDEINWALREFGSQTANNLELQSTMIYADREAAARNDSLDLDELVRRVLEIKPRFPEEFALRLGKGLAEKGFFRATTA